MRAISDDLVLTDVPDPRIPEGSVMVSVTAAGVNRADLLQAAGHYPPPRGASPILGLEVSGTVEGRPVCALLDGGGYAELAGAPVGQVMPVPAGVGLVEAAALPEVACTVYSNLRHVRSGETVLIHGGGSGIGTFAIQWLTAIGARVIVTAGSAEKLQVCADLGADGLINYREEDFLVRVGELTEGRGVDTILDVVGAKYLDRNIRCLAVDGRLVVIGMQGGVKGELDIGRLLARRGTVTATSLRARPAAEKARICSEVVEHVWPLVEQGRIRPVVDRILPLAEAADAHRVMRDSTHVGKILLTT